MARRASGLAGLAPGAGSCAGNDCTARSGNGWCRGAVQSFVSLVPAPLPFPDSNQLVRIGGNIPLFNTYSSTFERRERLTPIFSNVMAHAPLDVGRVQAQLSTAGEFTDVNVQTVTAEFFETMLASPRMGRGFAKEPQGASVVVLSDRLWRTELRGNKDVIGSIVRLLGHPFTVVGVTSEGFGFPAGDGTCGCRWKACPVPVPVSSSSVACAQGCRWDRLPRTCRL